MNSRMLTWILVCLLAGACGCNEEFSPKVFEGNRYYLFCIVNAIPQGVNVQFALLDRMYDVPGLNPSANRVDPFVAGGLVILSVRGEQDTLAYGTTARKDTTRYQTPIQYYVSGPITIIARDLVFVQATLPDGTVLTGSTVIPAFRPTESTPDFALGVTTLLNRDILGDTWVLDWEDGVIGEHLFFPHLTLSYSITNNDTTHQLRAPVPLRYVQQNGQPTPVYPTLQTTGSLSVDFDALDQFLSGIGADVTDKSTIHLQAIVLNIIECDISLSRYYSSVNGYLDQFSVRLDERTYSNVRGGDGIVGSATTTSFTYPVNARYAAHFGYKAE
jgi:hypothetical protein